MSVKKKDPAGFVHGKFRLARHPDPALAPPHFDDGGQFGHATLSMTVPPGRRTAA